MSTHLLENRSQTLLADLYESWIFQHKYYQESIEKNDKWEEKIQFFWCHVPLIGQNRLGSSLAGLLFLVVYMTMISGFDGVKLNRK